MDGLQEEKIIVPEKNWRLDLVLFLSFLKIASITVGGGYAILAAAREEFICRRRWLSDDDFSEMMTVIITVPGLLAINSAIYLGWKLHRFSGALTAALGALLPSVTVIMLIAAGLSAITGFLQNPFVQGAFKGILCGIIAMIGLTVIKMGKSNLKSIFDWCMILICILGIAAWHWNPAILIAGAIAAGILKVSLGKRGAAQ
ncbi:MAG: chromate transporter [Lentisphaeria bacterium]|nr:chromate transporter [Lentisphaeria bacterium]